ncbi:FAD-dependent oxidoreductase [Nostoc sp.]|uniref:FAD-dependent oxidoreductase n=1 Tax=Nostoc sp. TaxID=1180 RepID=UPI002FFADE51
MDEKRFNSILFPKLSDAQIAQIEKFAQLKSYRDREVICEVGDRDFCFSVIKSGKMAIVDRSGGEEKIMAVAQEKQFTGDVSLLTGDLAVLSAIAQGDCEVYEVAAADLRQILRENSSLSDIILQAFIARRQYLEELKDFTGLRVIGSRFSRDTFRIRDFLAKNRVMFTWLDLENHQQVDALLKQLQISEADTPVVAYGNEWVLKNPATTELVERLGIKKPIQETLYDLAVVGAGPAGLAAAVYGASEGLNTIVLEHIAPGGQAGTSSKIENYLGFPTGISGSDLANSAVLQANKFGARLAIPCQVVKLAFEDGITVLHLGSGEQVAAKCVLIATGVEYHKLNVEGRDRFDGAGIYYAATTTEAQMCSGSQVAVVGAANSAGQAAVFLAEHVEKVWLLIRGDDLEKSMSRYLICRIEQMDNIELLCNTEISQFGGDDCLRSIKVSNHKTGETRSLDVTAVFTFIGAVPRTDWLSPALETDDKGFIKTGLAVADSAGWSSAQRQPFLLETSRPGIFAAGDVRLGSIKRVASAVGEGSMAVQFIHQYLASI